MLHNLCKWIPAARPGRACNLVGQITENWNALMAAICSSGPIIKSLWEATRPRTSV